MNLFLLQKFETHKILTQHQWNPQIQPAPRFFSGDVPTGWTIFLASFNTLPQCSSPSHHLQMAKLETKLSYKFCFSFILIIHIFHIIITHSYRKHITQHTENCHKISITQNNGTLDPQSAVFQPEKIDSQYCTSSAVATRVSRTAQSPKLSV